MLQAPGLRPDRVLTEEAVGRRRGWIPWAVVAALLIMMAVYFIPHSLRGSTLDYNKLDEGVPAEDAIGTG